MEEVEFRKLSWPRKMNLDILAKFLTEEEMKQIIIDNCREIRTNRRIQLPSTKCIKKVLIFYLVEKYQGNMGGVMEDLKGSFKFLKQLGLERCHVKNLYEQRQKEIEQENDL